MSRLAATLLCGLVMAQPVAAMAQDSEDWDLGRDPDRRLTLAAVSFENFGVAVRCVDQTLSVIISGVPEGRGLRTVSYQLGDRPEEQAKWIAGGDGTSMFAVWPVRTAAGLSQGGRLRLGFQGAEQVRRMTVDLPPSQASIGEVFKACGRELSPATETDAPGDIDLGGLRWANLPDGSFPTRTNAGAGLAAIVCRVKASGRLEDCKVESEFPEGAGFGRATVVSAHRTGRVEPLEGQDTPMEGREIAFYTRYRLADEVALPPTGTRILRNDGVGSFPARDD